MSLTPDGVYRKFTVFLILRTAKNEAQQRNSLGNFNGTSTKIFLWLQ